MMAMKKSVWDMILKVVIAVASALAGVLGANAMNNPHYAKLCAPVWHGGAL